MARRFSAPSAAAALLLLGLAVAAGAAAVGSAVTYDRKAVLINGQRRILFSGSIHYPRSTPEVTAFFPKCLLFLLEVGNFFLGGLMAWSAGSWWRCR
jgi:hypothetical protein